MVVFYTYMCGLFVVDGIDRAIDGGWRQERYKFRRVSTDLWGLNDTNLRGLKK